MGNLFKIFGGFTFLFVLMTIFSMTQEGQAAFANTTLSAPLAVEPNVDVDGNSALESYLIAVADSTGFLDPAAAGINFDTAVIDSELIRYTAIGTTSGGCTVGVVSVSPPCFLVNTNAAGLRGAGGTDIKPHSNAAVVYTESTGVLKEVVGFAMVSDCSNIVCGAQTVIMAPIWLLKSVAKMLTWNYAYLDGASEYFKLILYALSAGLVVSLFALLMSNRIL
ncbi:hypothetical protein CMI37_29690 [Candidatus Pacearchaeota archaeon]|nr:hypothetical protein [Candidatus Pacearchaeota archaeon]